MGHGILHDPYITNIVRGVMTRNLSVVFPDVRDEVINAVSDVVPARSSTGA